MICFRCKTKYVLDKHCPHCSMYSKFNNTMVKKYIKRVNYKSKLVLNYNLTKTQQEISLKIQKTKKDILVHAVCGSGKTEIVLNEIQNFLKENKRVGFFIPRIEIAREIHKKLKLFFPDNSISLIYGNKSTELTDIIVSTCHQAPKYLNQIDLTILDEVDAFPLSKMNILQKICFNLAREKTIFLSATPPDYLPKNIDIIELNNRFHNKPIPMPEVKKTKVMQLHLLKILKNNKTPLFVFFPTIKIQNKYYNYFKNKFNIKKINSKTKNNKKKLYNFRSENTPIIFTTSVLERGVTFPKLNIVVINADHDLYNSNALIQIVGRVGRSQKYPNGQSTLLCFNQTHQIKKTIQEIKFRNEMSNLHS